MNINARLEIFLIDTRALDMPYGCGSYNYKTDSDAILLLSHNFIKTFDVYFIMLIHVNDSIHFYLIILLL